MLIGHASRTDHAELCMQGEVDPEELFNMFFNGGFGGPFGGAFGGPG